ncbi:MAG: PIN domain-containing protein [Paludibacteraceae bacterium]|nr:PIN domain-containing protein [Paludibacteraceae bacterium]MBQ9672611.1 PIN domain-containing protein [Prevotella sp.]
MGKKVFLDTNILIDYLASRRDYVAASTIVTMARDGNFCLLVSSLSFATASYIMNAHHKKTNAEIVAMFAEFVKMCNVTPVDSLIVDEAIASRFYDFEDAMQYYSAIREGADAIITRNSSDFGAAEIEVYEPQQFLDMLSIE